MAQYDDKVYELSDEKALELIPVIVIVGLLILIGLLGNPLVVYFYGFRMNTTASYMFIVTLAIFDLVSCSISMPLEIVDMVKFYSFENGHACRTFRFINYFASITSGTVLIAIAVDRFRKICRPFKKQISIKLARIIIVCCIAFSAFCSWPSLVFYDVVSVNITDDTSVVGFDCTTKRDEQYKVYITVYNIYLFLLFIVAIIVLVVLYCFVGRQLFNLRKFRFYATKRKPSALNSIAMSHTAPSEVYTISDEKKSSSDDGMKVSNKTETKNENFENGDSDRPRSTKSIRFDGPIKIAPEENNCENKNGRQLSVKSHDLQQTENGNDNKNKKFSGTTKTEIGSGTTEMSHVRIPSVDSAGKGTDVRSQVRVTRSSSKRKMEEQSINTKKYTIITISITIAFIFSYLPYLALMTWRTLHKDYEVNVLSGGGLVAFQLFIRSYLFSSACNPIIYGLLNSEFKAMVTDSLNRICCRCCGKVSRDSRKEMSGTSAGSSY